ncbi:hypothetical protein M514_23657 [Trichuris suis]|uniref:Uncharacterized protein n=1 Tax=Trichuris suis TaxID=68888 RepID=A0A085N3X2_9BILA|nr:hypothetical protein M514_23657 [Trichuris suis]
MFTLNIHPSSSSSSLQRKMQWFALFLIALGCSQLSTVRSEKCLTKTSTSYYYEYSKIQVERVHWKYEQKERTVAIGCVLDSGENLSFGQIYRSSYFVLRCDKINDTAVVLTPYS